LVDVLAPLFSTVVRFLIKKNLPGREVAAGFLV